MMNHVLLIIVLFCSLIVSGQQNYCDFEGVKSVTFGPSTGVMDSLALNPNPDNTDNSAHCGKYIRDTTLYDNFKLYPHLRLSDINSYASNNALAPKITMKVYTSAPPGTIIECQLGAKSDDSYPTGFHSLYRTYTTSANRWQNLEFDFIQLIPGGLVSTFEIDKIMVLIHPNSLGTETVYFDDLSGPPLIPSSVESGNSLNPILYQSMPNPASKTSRIVFEIRSSGIVSLELFNLLSEPIRHLLNQSMNPGIYSVLIETEGIPNGIYFYILNQNDLFFIQKLVISN